MEKKSTKIAYGVALAIVVVALVIAKVANDGSGFVATGWDHSQYRMIGNNYNQVVKELRCHFSEKKAMALLYKLRLQGVYRDQIPPEQEAPL